MASHGRLGVTSYDSEWRVERRVEKTQTRSGEWAGLALGDLWINLRGRVIELMILKPAGTNRDGILIFCFGELLFVFVFYSRNDYRLRISVVNMLMLPRRTCNDMQTFELDFISHPEECNGENNLGSL